MLFCQPALAPFGRTPVLGIAPDSVVFAIAYKLQEDIGLSLRQGILGTQHGFFPVLTAGNAVEGKADGVKNRRFPCPGISGDQIKSLCAEFIKIYYFSARIGSESGHLQSNWSHAVILPCLL